MGDKADVKQTRDEQHAQLQAQQEHQQAVETAGAAKDAGSAMQSMTAASAPPPAQGAPGE